MDGELTEPLLAERKSNSERSKFGRSRSKHSKRRNEVAKRVRTISAELVIQNSDEASQVTERASNVDTLKHDVISLEEEDLPVSPLTKAKTGLVVLVTIVAVAAYCVSFPVASALGVSTTSFAVLGAAAGVCVLMTPAVWFNEWKLIHYPAMRRGVNSLRHEANNLKQEVKYLKMEISELESEIKTIEEGNAKLQDITQVQDKNMDSLVDLVAGNQEILNKMREYLREAILQDVIKSILRSDEDRDGMLNKVEAKALEARLKISLDAFGVVFDVEKFHTAIGLSPSLCSVFRIAKRLLPDEHNKVSSFYSINSDDELSEPDDEDDTYDMFYIPVERETKLLCPETLRLCQMYHEKNGRRPSLLSLAPKGLRDKLMRFRCEVGLIGCDCEEDVENP